ncbi:MAG: nuclease-related domain-containing protein [Clostridium sp.]
MLKFLSNKVGITYVILVIISYKIIDEADLGSEFLTQVLVGLMIAHLLIYFIGKLINKEWKEIKRDGLGRILMGIITVVIINLAIILEVKIMIYAVERLGNSLLISVINVALLAFFILGMPMLFIVMAAWLNDKVVEINKFIEMKNLEKKNNPILDQIDEEISRASVGIESNYVFKEEEFYRYNERLDFEKVKPKEIYCTNDERYDGLVEQIRQIKKLEEEIQSIDISDLVERKSLLRDSQNVWVNNWIQKEIKLRRLLACRREVLESDLNSTKSGIEGEQLIDRELNQYPNIYNLSNIRVEEKDNDGMDQSVENDNIVIARQGVFVIEVKNIGSKGAFSIKIERDGRWIKRYGKREAIMKSPTEQNNRHILYINKIINRLLKRDVENYLDAEGIVVIANDAVTIENQSQNQMVLRKSEIYLYIKKQKNVLSIEEMNILKEYFLKNNLGGKKYPYNDYAFELRKNIEDYNKGVDIRREEILKMKELANMLDEINN